MKIGIDFGTSFSIPAIVHLDQNLILLPGGMYGIPSVFFYTEYDNVLIGEEAERAGQGEDAKNMKREIKMELKNNNMFLADGRSFTAQEIVGHILNYVVENAIITAGEKLINDNIEGVVISVPAAFEHNEKALIKDAAEKLRVQGGSELKVLGLIKEPVAAGLSYFKSSLADKTRILVYDLGGGTCDVAIIEADSTLKEKYSVIDSDMLRIGGKDWDTKVGDYIIHEIEKQCGKSIRTNPGYMEKIKRESIVVKHALSEKVAGRYRDKAKARIEIDGVTYQVPITKEVVEEMTGGLFKQTVGLAKGIIKRNGSVPIEKIICVGGSTKMPQIYEGLEREFPHMEVQIFEPEKAIAFGAAIYAQHCDGTDYFLSDVASFSYGNRQYKDYDRNPDLLIIRNHIIKGSKLPIVREYTLITIKDCRSGMSFYIYENSRTVDSYDYKEEKSLPILSFTLDFQKEVPKGTKCKLQLSLNMDGIIEAKAYDEDGHSITVKKKLSR